MKTYVNLYEKCLFVSYCTRLQLEMSEMTIFNRRCWQVKFKKKRYVMLSYVTLFLVIDDRLVGI